MQFDEYSVALLILRPDAPKQDADAARALTDAHLAYLAALHEAGKLVAAGPFSDDHYRGMIILNVGVEEARTLEEADPAVKAGRFSVQVMRWMLPSGAMHFTPTHFPRSTTEAEAR